MALALTLAPALRADEEPAATPSIVADIMADSINIIVQPEGLARRVLYHEPEKKPQARPSNSRAGFRVQIFSDGNQTSARNNARARIRTVTARFPQYRSYLDYKSPYWRAKVGDFKTRDEANEAASRIRSAFPAFSKEVRVVPDRISILETTP